MGGRYAAVLADQVARRLILVKCVSYVGDFVAVAALILLAFETSGSILVAGAVVAARGLPALGAAAALGRYLDGVPRRTGLVCIALAQAVIFAIPAVWPNAWAAALTSALTGIAVTAYGSLQTALVVDAVAPSTRPAYFALSGTVLMFAQVAGFLGGGSLALALSPRLAFTVNVCSFLVAAALLAGLPPDGSRERERVGGASRDRGRGWGIVWRHPTLRTVAILLWACLLSAEVPEVLAPSISSTAWTPFVMAASTLGTAVFVAWSHGGGPVRGVRGQIAFGLAYAVAFLAGGGILLGDLGSGPIAAANLAIGVANGWFVGAQATFADVVDPARMAQVESAMVSANITMAGLGLVVLSAIAEWTTPAVAYFVSGGLVAPVAIWALRTQMAGRTPTSPK